MFSVPDPPWPTVNSGATVHRDPAPDTFAMPSDPASRPMRVSAPPLNIVPPVVMFSVPLPGAPRPINVYAAAPFTATEAPLETFNVPVPKFPGIKPPFPVIVQLDPGPVTVT